MGRKGKRKAKGGGAGGSKEGQGKHAEEIPSASEGAAGGSETGDLEKEEQHQEETTVESSEEGLHSRQETTPSELAGEIGGLAISVSEPSTSVAAIPDAESAAEQSSPIACPEPTGLISKGSMSPPVIGSVDAPTLETREQSATSLKPLSRPDRGGNLAIKTLRLVANFFPVKFDPAQVIYHYDFDTKKASAGPKGKQKKTGNVSREDALEIKKQLVESNPRVFRNASMVYDGKRNIFSAMPLRHGKYVVKLSRDEDAVPKEYIVEMKATSHELSTRTLADFLNTRNRDHVQFPQDLVQAMDLVLRENPSASRVMVGRSLYPKFPDEDIRGGAVAARGFYQSLRPTAQGLMLNVDYTVLAFHKSVPVLDFLAENCSLRCRDSQPLSDQGRRNAEAVLKGIKIRVTHRRSNQKFVVRGLTREITRNIRFEVEGNDGQKRATNMVDFFRQKYNLDIRYKLLPCLDISKSRDKPNYLPMEVCVICEGQKIRRDDLDSFQSKNFQPIACPPARQRLQRIMEIMNRPDGPRGGSFASEFHMTVGANMTEVPGRVLAAPQLRLGGRVSQVIPNPDTRQWNLLNNKVVDGKRIDRWGIVFFTWNQPSSWHQNLLQAFCTSLVTRCKEIGIPMAEYPVSPQFKPMAQFSNPPQLRQTLQSVHRAGKEQIQILMCVMEERHPGYSTLKLIAETEIGLVTQCCLLNHVEKCDPRSDRRTASQASQYLANLGQKMNAKLGGSNTALFHSPFRQFPRFGASKVMYVGADVNHPAPGDKRSPSVAAVVGSINWPESTRYIARISYQTHRQEHIQNLEEMFAALLKEYRETNKGLPDKILFYRDGVSESQFEMVCNEEMPALKAAVGKFRSYDPQITFIVAQKRHHARLFFHPAEQEQTQSGNVPSGTVVDQVIIHPREFDFYLCSHNGMLGTSKPTRYIALYDENGFSSDELQTITYNMCFTFARCTKPVSIPPPVYYADLAAYRGRQYVEAMIAAASDGASSTSSSSSSSIPLNYPEIQDAIGKTMFFC